MDSKQKDIYQRIREQVNEGADKVSAKHGRQVASWLLLLPDLFALCIRLTLDPRVSFHSKGLLGVAMLYLISPVDLIPEVIFGPLGLLDDLAFIVLALRKMKMSQPDPNILAELWSGDGDVLAIIEDISSKLTDFVDHKILAKIKQKLGGS